MNITICPKCETPMPTGAARCECGLLKIEFHNYMIRYFEILAELGEHAKQINEEMYMREMENSRPPCVAVHAHTSFN